MRTTLLLASLLCSTAFVSAEPTALFDGKTLEGWDFDPKIWRVEDGVITGGSSTQKIDKNYFISTRKSFQNFELKLKIKCSGDPKTGMLNSGIQIRSVWQGTAMSGYQIDCGEGWFGKIYDEHRRNKVIWAPPPDQQAALDKAVDVFGWNEYRIRAEGPRIQTWINGVKCIDYTEADPNIALDGHIAPQVHSGGACTVQVKDVTVEELPPTPGAPTWKTVKPIKHEQPKAAKGKRDTSYNDVQGSALTAEEQLKKFHLPPEYEIELVVKESPGIGKFISVYFDQRGRMWTQTALEYPVDANENPAAAEALYAGKGKDKVLVYPREALAAPLPKEGLTKPVVFADGLAIPLGLLPWGVGDSAYILHGHDIKLFKDSNGDGKADESKVILTGLGVQDSHLFPHQFTRAPGGWIWMAQGLFNNSKVQRPGENSGVDWPKCSMARMRPDGSEFEVISTGPNNIWGLAMTGEGETFIQEANDYGYPVMPFHEYAYYPGGMEALKKSYQPDFPPQAEFRMGGTGLSGLALVSEKKDHLVMAVANPIISKIQQIDMKRQPCGPAAPTGWHLEQLADLVTCDDPFFRPVALSNGPDGCIYIVDWYNKIISHNEVPRNHPDRDKTRGRIWRVKPKLGTLPLPDFTQLSNEELTAMLGAEPSARAHLAWQTLLDRQQLASTHWSQKPYSSYPAADKIIQAGRSKDIAALLTGLRPSIQNGPTAPGRTGKPIPVGEAYEREFERFLVRMFLERDPDLTAQFLDSDKAQTLPVEARVLASLALEPKTSATRVAKLLPLLERAPNDEELLRLAQFPDEAGCGEALKALLANPKSRVAVADKLVAQKTKLDPTKIAPLLSEAAKSMLGGNDDERALGVSLIGGFQLSSLESDLVAMSRKGDLQAPSEVQSRRSLLLALRELRSEAVDLFVEIIKTGPATLRDDALAALTASKSPAAAEQLFAIYSSLTDAQQKFSLNALSATKPGARAIVAALSSKRVPTTDLDGPTAERLSLVLGNDPELTKLMSTLGHVFHDVLAFDGSEEAWIESRITLDGPFTVETWIKLAPGIGNEDDVLGVPGGCEFNFFQSKFRVFAGRELHDVAVANKPMTPDLWTHLAVTRDAKGIIRIYQNGELDAESRIPVPMKWENCRIGWSGPQRGTEGMMAEFRVLNTARSATEIRSSFDRSQDSFAPDTKSFKKGVRIAKTTDYPPILSTEQAAALDKKFHHLTQLIKTPGDLTKGKALSAICTTCHQIGSTGGQIGPNLSSAGAMGLEAVLRNILTPNAAMEPGYRIFRVELKSGDLVDGFYVSEDKSALVVRQPGAPDRRIPRQDVRRTSYIRRSLMPEGLLDALNDEQARDLLTYLMSLK